MPNITHLIGTPVDTETVYKAISTVDGLRNWWTTDVSGDAALGGTLAFRFKGGGPDMVVEVMEKDRIEWRVSEGPEEWLGTRITFKLEKEEDGKTALLFTHSDWKAETPFHAHCSMKWACFLLSLKSYVELGTGQSFPDDIQIKDTTIRNTL